MYRFSEIIQKAFSVAQSEAIIRKNGELSHYHFLLGLIKTPQTVSGRVFKKYLAEIENKIKNFPTLAHSLSLEDLRMSIKLQEWITLANAQVIQQSKDEIEEKDLIKEMPKIFSELNIDYKLLSDEFNNKDKEIPDFLINLNDLAIKGKLDPVIGRTKEIRAVMEILGRRNKNNPVLVGSAGVGKTAIVEGLANAIVKEEVPNVLKNKIIYSLDLGALMAGTKFRGEFEERMQKFLKFVKESDGNIIVFIDELHQLVGAGRTEGAMDAANLLKPALARGDLHCIGATTDDEYRKYILSDSALDRRFRSVPVFDPSIEDAIEILMGIREKLEIHHGIKISDEAIFCSVILSTQYMTDKHLPDKAIDLVDEAASALKLSAEAMPAKLVEMESQIRSKMIYAQIEKNNLDLEKEIERLKELFNQEKSVWEKEVLSLKKVSDFKGRLDKLNFELEQAQRNQNYEYASKIKYSLIPEIQKELDKIRHDWVLTEKNIAQVISRQKGIPVDKILKSRQEKILGIKDFLQEKIFGQDYAISEISEILMSAYAGLTNEKKPLASFLLLGPSGVGKTETAKKLNEFLFDGAGDIIRFDMSEFSEKHSVAKLIGAPAGYIGHEDGGVLTNAVYKKPYSVILFDEIEKAHFDFANILLQILDDARLTDNKGNTVSFKNTIIVMTSNSKDITKDFRAEVIGRIDAVLEYNQLGKNDVKKIVDRLLKSLNEKMKSKNIAVEIDELLSDAILQTGFSEIYGARPIESAFNRLVVRFLSRLILEGQGPKERVKLTFRDGETKILS